MKKQKMVIIVALSALAIGLLSGVAYVLYITPDQTNPSLAQSESVISDGKELVIDERSARENIGQRCLLTGVAIQASERKNGNMFRTAFADLPLYATWPSEFTVCEPDEPGVTVTIEAKLLWHDPEPKVESKLEFPWSLVEPASTGYSRERPYYYISDPRLVK